MLTAIECAGAPRDLGLDQGLACREALRAAFARAPRYERWGFLARGPATRMGRDLARHFPHLAEALAGIAAGAGVSTHWLVRRLYGEVLAGGERALACASADAALLAVDADGELVLRRSRPDGGFACLEIARPWLASALAGVNENGLAVAVAGGAGGPASCAAPGALLAQDCLQRFSRLENALDWCCARPAGYTAALLLADARGEIAGIEIRGDERRVLRPEASLLAWADGASARVELAKNLREAAPAGATALAGVLAPGARALVLDPAQRRLAVVALAEAEREPRWHTLAAA